MTAYEQKLKNKQERVDQMTLELNQARDTIGTLKESLDKQNEKIIEMEQGQFENDNVEYDLVNQLQDLEQQNENMELKIEQLIEVNEELEKKQAVYIAHKDCKIDKAIEKYVNMKFPEKQDRLQIMFLRESEGVYQFGQKRVHVKIERGDQIFIRVGGGFMHIEEFIK